MMRVVASAAKLEQDPSVILVQPEMAGLAQWSMADVPRLIAEGRRAAREALDAADSILFRRSQAPSDVASHSSRE